MSSFFTINPLSKNQQIIISPSQPETLNQVLTTNPEKVDLVFTSTFDPLQSPLTPPPTEHIPIEELLDYIHQEFKELNLQIINSQTVKEEHTITLQVILEENEAHSESIILLKSAIHFFLINNFTKQKGHIPQHSLTNSRAIYEGSIEIGEQVSLDSIFQPKIFLNIFEINRDEDSSSKIIRVMKHCAKKQSYELARSLIPLLFNEKNHSEIANQMSGEPEFFKHPEMVQAMQGPIEKTLTDWIKASSKKNDTRDEVVLTLLRGYKIRSPFLWTRVLSNISKSKKKELHLKALEAFELNFEPESPQDEMQYEYKDCWSSVLLILKKLNHSKVFSYLQAENHFYQALQQSTDSKSIDSILLNSAISSITKLANDPDYLKNLKHLIDFQRKVPKNNETILQLIKLCLKNKDPEILSKCCDLMEEYIQTNDPKEILDSFRFLAEKTVIIEKVLALSEKIRQKTTDAHYLIRCASLFLTLSQHDEAAELLLKGLPHLGVCHKPDTQKAVKLAKNVYSSLINQHFPKNPNSPLFHTLLNCLNCQNISTIYIPADQAVMMQKLFTAKLDHISSTPFPDPKEVDEIILLVYQYAYQFSKNENFLKEIFTKCNDINVKILLHSNAISSYKSNALNLIGIALQQGKKPIGIEKINLKKIDFSSVDVPLIQIFLTKNFSVVKDRTITDNARVTPIYHFFHQLIYSEVKNKQDPLKLLEEFCLFRPTNNRSFFTKHLSNVFQLCTLGIENGFFKTHSQLAERIIEGGYKAISEISKNSKQKLGLVHFFGQNFGQARGSRWRRSRRGNSGSYCRGEIDRQMGPRSRPKTDRRSEQGQKLDDLLPLYNQALKLLDLCIDEEILTKETWIRCYEKINYNIPSTTDTKWDQTIKDTFDLLENAYESTYFEDDISAYLTNYIFLSGEIPTHPEPSEQEITDSLTTLITNFLQTNTYPSHLHIVNYLRKFGYLLLLENPKELENIYQNVLKELQKMNGTVDQHCLILQGLAVALEDIVIKLKSEEVLVNENCYCTLRTLTLSIEEKIREKSLSLPAETLTDAKRHLNLKKSTLKWLSNFLDKYQEVFKNHEDPLHAIIAREILEVSAFNLNDFE